MADELPDPPKTEPAPPEQGQIAPVSTNQPATLGYPAPGAPTSWAVQQTSTALGGPLSSAGSYRTV
jgi:hypothetical protein